MKILKLILELILLPIELIRTSLSQPTDPFDEVMLFIGIAVGMFYALILYAAYLILDIYVL